MSCLIGITFKIEWIDFLLNIQQIPNHYLNYVESGRVTYDVPFFRVLSKYIFIPFYLFALLQVIGKNKLTTIEEKLFLVGFLSFCLRLITIKVAMIARVTDFFLLLSILPLYFCFKEMLKDKYYARFCYAMGFLFIVYFFKTLIVPEDVYLYKSIYFG
jgi:hypothetical protein